MKLRFLAAAGPPSARAHLATHLSHSSDPSLSAPASAGSLSVWVERGTPLLIDKDNQAILVGLLFDRSRRKRVNAIPSARRLDRTWIRNFWGSYVLFTSEGISHSVFRDPSGSVPVYCATARGLELYASDADMLRLARAGPFCPDLGAACHWLRFPFLRTARTGALGITELFPGMARDVGTAGNRLRDVWTAVPEELFDSPSTSFHEAATLLRQEILGSVACLAGGEPDIVLQLSGGLDSSVLAAALAHGGVKFRAMTFATHSAGGDERQYAREVACRFGVELVEITEGDIDLSVRMTSSPLQRPPSPFLQSLRETLLGNVGSDALLVDGGGGDNVFASINAASPIIDAFGGLGVKAAVRTARNLAARHGCTFWAAATSALRRALRARAIPWPPDDSFLPSPSRPDMPDSHPWLDGLGKLPPGSADHLRMIAGVHHFLVDPARRQPCNLHPLISQPIVETCLRIRSWLWFEGGRDRAVVRAAFRNFLPDAILDRRGKGSLQNMFSSGFTARRSELRDYLVSGRLAAEGIIDAAAIGAYFDRRDQPRDMSYLRLLEIASAEQWLRSFG